MRSIWVVVFLLGLVSYQAHGRFIVKRETNPSTTAEPEKSEENKEEADKSEAKEGNEGEEETDSKEKSETEVEAQKVSKESASIDANSVDEKDEETTTIRFRQSNHVDDDNAEATE
ncbi:unnamed protein product [Bursaphelenchus xylophilus]|uniref:(pine wood nematode) hypothetical protein n=1 Tax=Bursaphelenchus xylophilus TaxID=6326 RepID=A0A1I7RH50_BURXY|nr:unnamed protein product [Bursaphelenchus xylophilus]CAG9115976.1 unnamed protein product [Bursaphelenchus xylophilus]